MTELLDGVPLFSIYTLTYNGTDIPKLEPVGHSSSLARQTGYKLYVVTSQDTVLYVGVTKTSFTSRLRLGHQRIANPLNGYHGYKWLRGSHARNLHLYLLNLESLMQQALTCSPKELAERLEAELVFAIRTATGAWPIAQHEIHFHNLTEHPELARYTTHLAEHLLLQLPAPCRQPVTIQQS
jgi:predicted GIY-YIG superfamily endonuclease